MFIIRRDSDHDNSLWNRFLAGDDDAFCHIYEKYARNLIAQGLQFSSDKEFVKDCIHDIFVKIYDNRANLKPVQNLKVYLFVALRNSIITALKKQKIWIDELDEGTTNTSDYKTVEEDFIRIETESRQDYFIKEILSILTIRQKEVVYYRFIESMSIDEISDLMAMNYQSVQNLLQRSIKKIRDFIKKSKKVSINYR
ncbi:MAG: sigma-70 family RNA polymerase sigma factor [Prevotella sp.]|jgi:RNA polymerase sigma factor (sigma-70 family)|nr:sigma-70 family RNA polymerase sigma factor [Prevotella sp.]